ncbi:MAG: hypothetical protein QG577_170 [Thermodesulfobacteriota bacterium]|nr:hypothetical protein [Thermodesulfobacteriota bacterium]
MTKIPDDRSGSFNTKSPTEYLHYFGEDRALQFRLRDKRTQFFSFLFPRFQRAGLLPDTISYIGISLLAGVILYFVRDPVMASLFLAGHIICDGLDGAFARHTGMASQSGAFTDLVCDQLGMVVVGLMAIFHHMVSPLLGTVYIALYLIVVVFGVIINVMGLRTRITITSKYFLYGVYGIWAGWEINLFPWLISFFSVIMALEVVVGYVRLKRGLRRKFDSQVEVSGEDVRPDLPYHSINIALPILVLVIILIGANIIPIRSIFAHPTVSIAWTDGPTLTDSNENVEILGLSVHDDRIVIMVRLEDGTIQVRRFFDVQRGGFESFAIPEYVNPSFSTFPISEGVLFVADSSTRLLLGIDMDASIASRRAVIVLTLPLGYLRVTAMSVINWNDKKMWLAANYLYTRRTYLVDPDKALKKGYILGGVVASYANGSFPSGMTAIGHNVLELNRAPMNPLVFEGSLKKLIHGKSLVEASKRRFVPPHPDAMGPLKWGENLIMLAPSGSLFTAPFQKYLSADSG